MRKKANYKVLHAGRLRESEINFVFCERELFGSIGGLHTARKRKSQKALQPCEFRAVRKKKKAVKNVFDHRFDHLHDHNLITIGV